MDKQEVIEKLRNVMRDASEADVDWDSVSGDTAIADLGFDSLSILDLIYDIQQAFDLDFEAEQLVSVRTVDELADFLLARLG